jgi:tRNA1Val (adenine37-N6)-methyltransferase
MANTYFQFKQFTIHQDKCAMKVCTDSCVFGSVLPIHTLKGNKITNTLDIGTGTGLLSLMYAQLNEDATITALEIDKEATQQANDNIEQSIFKHRINVYNYDFNDYENQQKFDLIFCNPPFYENDLKSNIKSKNIAHHSTSLTIGDLLKKSKDLLNIDGIICLLAPHKRSAALEILFEENNLFYYRKINMHQNEKINEEEIIIKNEKNYTQKFNHLLQDFYLNI